MRVWATAVVCGLAGVVGLAGLAGCSGASSSGGGGSQQQNQPPTANAGGPYSGTAGTAISFSATGSSDPQGQALTYAWNFGDSTTGTGANPSHTYGAVGSYTVSLTVMDTSGLSGSTTSKATVGLAGVALTGTVMSGTQPVANAHVYLLAAKTTGYGGNGIAASSTNASVSLLNASLAGASDSVGAYVTTNASGAFSLSGDYTCASGQQLYLYATGAAGAAWMAAVGACPGTSGPAIVAKVNEVSTVAAAYAFAGFATDATHVSSSGTALAQTGIANAFLNAGNLETLSTGAALATTPAGNGTVPQTEINTLANILASCAGGGAQCAALFADATADGTSTGAKPTETATAAINIAHHPGVNAAGLYALAGGTPPFAPGLSAAPNDWTVVLAFTGALNNPVGIAVDAQGEIWVANAATLATALTSSIAKFSSSGSLLSGPNGFGQGTLRQPVGIAIDQSGNAWIASQGVPFFSEMSNTGTLVSSLGGYSPSSSALSVAVDGQGNAWFSDGNFLSEFSNAGLPALPGNAPLVNHGLQSPIGRGIAVDGSGNLWEADETGYVTEVSPSGTFLSGATGFIAGGCCTTWAGISMDRQGNEWISNYGDWSVMELAQSGTLLSPSTGFTGGATMPRLEDLVIDGAGHLWILNGNLYEMSNTGTLLSSAAGYSSRISAYTSQIAADGSGNIWGTAIYLPSYPSTPYVVEFVGVSAPVITPIAAGLPATPTLDGSSSLGTRP